MLLTPDSLLVMFIRGGHHSKKSYFGKNLPLELVVFSWGSEILRGWGPEAGVLGGSDGPSLARSLVWMAGWIFYRTFFLSVLLPKKAELIKTFREYN